MPKLKGPLFGLQAHGTVADSLTYRHRRRQETALTVPTHPDANTLRQRRHRFLYRLGIALWNGFTPVQKAYYRTQAIGTPMIAMNVWLRLWLTTTPNLTFCLSLEEGQGHDLADLSPNATHFRRYGPSWVQDDSKHALLADGIDDFARVSSPTTPTITTAEHTVICRAARMSGTGAALVINSTQYSARGYALQFDSTNRLFWSTNDDTGLATATTIANAIVNGVVASIAIRRQGGTIGFFIDGVDRTSVANAGKVPGANTYRPTLFCRPSPLSTYSNVKLEYLAFFSRALSDEEIKSINRTFRPKPPLVID